MNMQQATGDASVPSNFSQASGTTAVGGLHNDNDLSLAFHAVFMGGTFVILLPLGVMWLRFFGKVTLHWLNNALSLFCLVIGLGLGINASLEYNQSKKFNSAHQVIGLILVAFAFVQATGGFIHHRIYKQTQRPTPIGVAHRYAGRIIILVGVVNGAM